jgi:hypothetical protein
MKRLSDNPFIRLAMEPPFRIFTRAILKRLPVSVETRALWDLSRYPAYLLGVVTGAEEALKQGVKEICVIEFGVAGGRGLLVLENEARAVEKKTGIKISVFGFDNGAGLPALCGDYRDHPDQWQHGDYPMDESALRSKLTSRTRLIIGNIKDTVREFAMKIQEAPIGFAAFDLDLYSSTRDSLQLFAMKDVQMLRHVPLYFDDIGFVFNHKFAGELLAIEEFNNLNDRVKIDKWHGLKAERPFPERFYLEKMYVAHDIGATPNPTLGRARRELSLY